MIEQNYRSKCCDAKVKVHGIPDFPGTKEICTMNFSCTQCGKSCNMVEISRDKTKAPTAKRRIRSQEKRLNFHGKVLKKLTEFLDGITISPTKGVILTPKKKSQLAELRKME